MDLQLAGRTAYITGGAQGIGAAIATLLVAEGVRVAVADLDAEKLESNRAQWSTAAGEPVLIHADLATADGAAAAVRAAVKGLGQVPQVLVNNVGVAVPRPFLDIDDKAWSQAFEVNFMSCVRTCRALLPLMRQATGASVINISSDLAKQPEPIPADYGSMKTGLLYLTKALSHEFVPDVRINAVLPGPVWTGLWSRPGGVMDRLATAYDTDREAALALYLIDRQMALGIAEPNDVASLVAYLASPLARRISGSAFDVGGSIRGLL